MTTENEATQSRLAKLAEMLEKAVGECDSVTVETLGRKGLHLADDLGDMVSRARCRELVGVSLTEQKRWSEAVTWLEQATQELPLAGLQPGEAWFALGSCRSALRDPSAAAHAYREAIDALEAMGRWDAALDARVRLLVIARTTGLIILNVAELAERVQEQARLLLRPEHVETRLWLPERVFRSSWRAVLAAERAGDIARMQWLSNNMMAGVDRLAVSETKRTVLRMCLAGIASQAAVSRGDLRAALAAVETGLDRLPKPLHRIPRRVRPVLVILLSYRANLFIHLGDRAAAAPVLQEAFALADRNGSPRLRAQLHLMAGKALDGEEAVRELKAAIGYASGWRGLNIRCEATLALAEQEEDPVAQLGLLEEVFRLADAMERAHRWLMPAGPGFVAWWGLVRRRLAGTPATGFGTTEFRALATAVKVRALAKVDPQAADVLLEQQNATGTVALGTTLAYDAVIHDVRRRSEDALQSAEPAARKLIMAVEAAGDLAEREAIFERLRELWGGVLLVLSARSDRQAAGVALELIEVANRGNLPAITRRGAVATNALEVDSDKPLAARFTAIAKSYQQTGTSDLKITERLSGRGALVFAVAVYEPTKSATVIRVAVQPDGPRHVTNISIDGMALQLLETLVTGSLFALWRTADDEAWTALSAALLADIHPPERTGDLRPTVVIVPGHPLLAGIPWCALRIGDSLLLHHFSVQISPALSLLTGEQRRSSSTDALVYLVPKIDGDDQVLAVDGEVSAWQAQHRWTTVMVKDRARLYAELARPGRWAVGYLATHGRGSGTEHQLIHADGSALTIDDALKLWWPKVTVLSSCHVGELKAAPGADPIGLPLAMLLRGADYVIGCNQRIPNRGAATIGGDLVCRLAAADAPMPVDALRRAQLAWLSDKDWRTELLAFWAPFQVVSLL